MIRNRISWQPGRRLPVTSRPALSWLTPVVLSAFLLPTGAPAQTVTVSNIRFVNVSHSSAGVMFQTSQIVNWVRLHYIPTAQGSCTSGSSGAYQYINTAYSISPPTTTVEMNLSGLAPNTQYQVCPEVSTNGNAGPWTSGVGATFTTLALPSTHPVLPIPPATFDTSYPDTTQGTCWSNGQPGYCQITETVTNNTCPNLNGDIASAIANQTTGGTVINIPAGSTCVGRVYWNQFPPDVITFDSTKVNSSASNAIYLPSHGLTEGQGVIFDYNFDTQYGGGAMGGVNWGAIYFVHVIDANNFQVYADWEQFSASTTTGSTTVSVQNMLGGYAMACGFQNLQPGCSLGVGSLVVGPGIPAGTTVTAYDTNAGTVTLSKAATATARNVTLTFGGSLATLTPGGTGAERLVKWPRSSLYWVIVRTSTPDSQFVPAGTRVSPAWASKMAVLQMPQESTFAKQMADSLITFGDPVDGGGNYFTSHMRFTGIEFTYSTPAGLSADPVSHYALINLGWLSNSDIVFDRDWFHNPNTRQDRVVTAFWMNGHNLAFRDSYFDNFEYWHPVYDFPGAYPEQDWFVTPSGSVGGTSFTIPAYNAIYYGAPSPATLPNGLTVSWTGTTSVSNAEIAAYFDMNDQLQVLAPQGLTVTAPGANITYTTNGGNASCQYGDTLMPLDVNGRLAAAPIGCAAINSNGQIASALGNGGIGHGGSWYDEAGEGCQCFIGGFGPGPYAFVNNYISATGNVIHFDDSGGAQVRGDYLIQRNTFHMPFSQFNTWDNSYAKSAGIVSDGYDYRTRQLLEWKGGQRMKIDGNIWDGSYHEVSGGYPFDLTPAGNGGTETDLDVTNNTFQHVPNVISLFTPYDNGIDWSGVTSGIGFRQRIKNNLAWDVNGLLYSTSSVLNFGNDPGNAAAGQVLYGGRGAEEDVIVDHNTFFDTFGVNSNFMFWFGYPLEGLSITNNILPYNVGAAGQNMFVIVQSANSACGGTGDSWLGSQINQTATDCNFVSGLGNPNMVLANNVIVPGWDCAAYPPGSNNCSGSNGNSQVTNATMTGSFPNYVSQNTWLPTSSTSTVPQSLASIGWWNTGFTPGLYDANGNYKGSVPDFHLQSASAYNSGKTTDGTPAGANIDQLEAAQGKVTLVGVPASSITSNSAKIAFVAPDAQGCPVDYSSSDPTLINNFTRAADAGGSRVRNIALTGLSGKTTYYYRVDCAVQQPTGSFRTN